MDVKVPLSQLSLASVLDTCHDNGVSADLAAASSLELSGQVALAPEGQEGRPVPVPEGEQTQYLDLETSMHRQVNTSVHAQYGPYSNSFGSAPGQQVADSALDYQPSGDYGPLANFSNIDMEAAGLTPYRGYGSYPSTFNYVMSPMQHQQGQQHQHAPTAGYYFPESGMPPPHGDQGLEQGKGFYHPQAGAYGGEAAHFAAMEQYGTPPGPGWPQAVAGPAPFHAGPGHFSAVPAQMLYSDQHCQFNRNWNALGGEAAGPGAGSAGEQGYGGLGAPQGSGPAKEAGAKRRSQGLPTSSCPQASSSGTRLGRPRGPQRRGMKRTSSSAEEGAASHSTAQPPNLSPPTKTTRTPESDREALMNIQTLKPRDIVSWYIDHLINENEAITEMSQSFTIPMNLFDTDETYFLESLAKKAIFPTRKFLNWMTTELPSLNPHAIDFTEGKRNRSPSLEWNPDGKTKTEIIQQTFYYFQERRNRMREQKRTN